MDVQIGQLQKPQPTQHQRLTKQAQKWVAQTFYGTMLKQMRNSPFKSDLFSGGRGGQVFNEMMDQRLADRMTRGSGSKLVSSIVRRIEAKSAYAKQQSQQPIVPPQPQEPQQKKTEPARTDEFKNVRIHVAPGIGT